MHLKGAEIANSHPHIVPTAAQYVMHGNNTCEKLVV